jgi:hypothetical protein
MLARFYKKLAVCDEHLMGCLAAQAKFGRGHEIIEGDSPVFPSKFYESKAVVVSLRGCRALGNSFAYGAWTNRGKRA